MTRDQVNTFLPLILAWRDGATIQLRYPSGWEDVKEDETVAFNSFPQDYRIKPKTKRKKSRGKTK